jgi:zinc D-Ala-D-Ala carboxypeptidase
MANWSAYPNFSASEFRCKHTGREKMADDFVRKLQGLRTEFGRPLVITSGYRDPSHPIEARKVRPGAHAAGRAVDIKVVSPATMYELIRLAPRYGFTGIGISFRSSTPKFLHLDDVTGPSRPAVWVY